MTQMNLSKNRNRLTDIENRLVVAQGEWKGGGAVAERWIWSLELVDANCYIYRMDKQGPTVQHRELYSISYDKP